MPNFLLLSFQRQLSFFICFLTQDDELQIQPVFNELGKAIASVIYSPRSPVHSMGKTPPG